MLKHFLRGLLLAGAFALPAAAQVQVSGPITAGHALKFVAPNVASDAGGAAGGVPGVGLTELGITKSVAVGPTGPAPFCLYDQAATLPSHQLCFDPGNGSNAIISVTSLGGAASEGLNLVINGTAYPVIGGGGNVVGPVSTAIPDLTVFNSTGGTAISSASVATFPAVLTQATARAQVNVGGFPAAGRLPAGVLENIVSMTVVPSTYSQTPWPNTQFSGYCDNQTTTSGTSCVNFFGIAYDHVGSNGGTWVFNGVLCNTLANASVCANGPASSDVGFDFGLLVYNECDSAIWPKTGGATPVGQVNCYLAVTGGSGTVAPTLDSYVLHIELGGSGAPPWSFAIATDAGSAVVGADFGALATGNNQSSQPVQLHSVSSGGTPYTEKLQGDTSGDLVLSATSVIAQTFNTTLAAGYTIEGDVSLSRDDTAKNTVLWDYAGNAAIFLGGSPGSAVNHYRNTSHSFEAISGSGTQYATFVAIGGSGSTSMQLQVNTGSGGALANVSVGSSSSCGSARCLTVPN